MDLVPTSECPQWCVLSVVHVLYMLDRLVLSCAHSCMCCVCYTRLHITLSVISRTRVSSCLLVLTLHIICIDYNLQTHYCTQLLPCHYVQCTSTITLPHTFTATHIVPHTITVTWLPIITVTLLYTCRSTVMPLCTVTVSTFSVMLPLHSCWVYCWVIVGIYLLALWCPLYNICHPATCSWCCITLLYAMYLLHVE